MHTEPLKKIKYADVHIMSDIRLQTKTHPEPEECHVTAAGRLVSPPTTQPGIQLQHKNMKHDRSLLQRLEAGEVILGDGNYCHTLERR